MKIHYIEVVTADVEQTCEAYKASIGNDFNGPIAELGNAFVTQNAEGVMLGVRAPMHEAEGPVVRPYWLVDDIQAAVDAAVAAGGQLAVPPMPLPGYGQCAIYMLGGNQHGLWQL